MKKADKERFYTLLDEMKYIMARNNLMSQKDICKIINELIVLKLLLEEKNKAFR